MKTRGSIKNILIFFSFAFAPASDDALATESNQDMLTVDGQLLSPAINLAKTSTPAVHVGGNTWEVVYTIKATNHGDGPGVYDVIDTLMPGNGITPIIDASYPAIVYAGGETQTGGMATPPLANGGTWVSLEDLGAFESESWTVTVRFTLDEQILMSSPSGADCVLTDGELGTGYMNYVEGSLSDEDFGDNETCVPEQTVSRPEIIKIDGFESKP